MNTYLVQLSVSYKNAEKKQPTEWVVNSNNQIEAQAQALYKENHTYSRSEIDALCLDSEYTELKEGDFHYKVVKVVELQELAIDEGGLNTVLAPKDTTLIDTLDSITPVSGDIAFCHVVIDWYVGGKRKEIKAFVGGRNEWVAIAHALDCVCGTITDTEADGVINKREIFDAGDSGSFALRSSNQSLLLSISIGDNSSYLVRVDDAKTATDSAILAVWDAGM